MSKKNLIRPQYEEFWDDCLKLTPKKNIKLNEDSFSKNKSISIKLQKNCNNKIIFRQKNNSIKSKNNHQLIKKVLTTEESISKSIEKRKQKQINILTSIYNNHILKQKKVQRQSSAISTKKIKYNQEFDPAQKNRIMDVNYLHLTKLPESKKFSHVDKAIINPVQSTFSVKKIVDDNIKRHEKMMKPIVLFPDPVRIYNQQPEKILPGSLRRSQEEIKEFENSNARKNMMVIGQGFGNKNNIRDNHVIFENPKEKKFRRKATSTRLARNTLKKTKIN